MGRGFNPNVVAEWQKVIRDMVILILAVFIVVFEVAFKDSPDPYALATALTLVGVPPALRIDQVRRSRRTTNGDPLSPSSRSPAMVQDDPHDGPGGHYEAPR